MSHPLLQHLDQLADNVMQLKGDLHTHWLAICEARTALAADFPPAEARPRYVRTEPSAVHLNDPVPELDRKLTSRDVAALLGHDRMLMQIYRRRGLKSKLVREALLARLEGGR